MNALTQLVLISLCVWAHGSALSDRDVPPRHGAAGGHGDGFYRNNQERDYEPFIYAAIPLHRPMPVLQVLSRRPLSRERTRESSAPRPVYVRAPDEDNDYAPSALNEYEYDERTPDDNPVYISSYGSYPITPRQPLAAPAALATQDEVTVIYARPNPQGGFIYRRPPTKSVPKRSPVSSTESPVVLRVHKYRIVRDR